MIARFLIVAIAALGAGCSSNPLLSSPEGKAVDAYLKQSLSDPEYQVVEWLPPEKNIPVREVMLAHARDAYARTQKAAKNLHEELKKESARLDRDQQRVDELTEKLAKARADADEADKDLDAIESKRRVFCRLRYRAKNSSHALVMQDSTFTVEGGQATPQKVAQPPAMDYHDKN